MIFQTRQFLSIVGWISSTPCRYYGRRTIKPMAVTDGNFSRSGRRYPSKEKKKTVYDEIGPEVRESLDNFESLDLDTSKFDSLYPQYQKDRHEQKRIIGIKRMERKHFQEYIEKEISVLTYAEKEQIRYLHRSDPEEWNEDNLATAFPITSAGVKKLLKSPCRARTVADIQRHDNYLSGTLEKIRSGEIKLNPELEAKMKIRNSIPINFGAISTPDLGLLVQDTKPKELGMFARLVAKNYSNDIDEDRENSSTAPEVEVEVKKTKKTNKSNSNNKITSPREVENYENQRIRPSFEESKMLGGMKKGRMTLEQFESEIQKAHKSGRIENNFPEIEKKKLEYMIYTRKKKGQSQESSSPIPTISVEETTEYIPTPDDFFNSSNIQKYKRNENSEENKDNTVEIRVENGQPYINTPEKGCEKPFSTAKDRIQPPGPHQKEKDSVYKVGDSFYDENGEFLYRPI